MYIQQADFFYGTSMTFAKAVMQIAEKKSYAAGETIFIEGDAAEHLYVLIEGRVRIMIGELGHIVYIVSKGGEAFGWSTLVGRQFYSAAAECLEPTTLLAFDRQRFQQVLEKDPVSGQILFKGLTKTLANRLLETYKMIAAQSSSEPDIASGSGQFPTYESAK
jgi:CRP-like cAMP-binding protein